MSTYNINLADPEDMREYIAHLKSARERLIETYTDVRSDSEDIANNVWRDTVSMQFMEMLDQRQKDLYHITEAFEHNQKVMESQLEPAEDLAQQSI